MSVGVSKAAGGTTSECGPKLITPPSGPMVAVSVAATVSAAHTNRDSDGGGKSRLDRTVGDVTLVRSSRHPVSNQAVVAAPTRSAPKSRLRLRVMADIADTSWEFGLNDHKNSWCFLVRLVFAQCGNWCRIVRSVDVRQTVRRAIALLHSD